MLKDLAKFMTSTGDVETRAVIKICVGLGKTSTETISMLKSSDDVRGGTVSSRRPTVISKVK